MLLPMCVNSVDYNYGQFENFIVTRSVFRDEMKLVPVIRRLRDQIKEHRNVLVNIRDNHDTKAGFANELSESRRNISMLKSEIRSLEPHFGSPKDFEGAIRGLLIIKDTYQVRAEEMARGCMNLKSPSSRRYSTYCSQGLGAHDMVNLAGVALSNGWIDDAISFTKEGLSILKKEKNVKKHPREIEHLRQLHKFKAMLPRINNDFLTKRRSLVGNGFKICPFLVDEELEKKKQQPKYLPNILDEYNTKPLTPESGVIDGDAKEHHFRRVCREDVIGSAVKKQFREQKCQFLHHGDPYLKLGPFKMEILLADPFRMIFHDILNEEEMKFMIDHAGPRLSTKRAKSEGSEEYKKNRSTHRIIHKTVQVWIEEKKYDEEAQCIYDPETDTFITQDFKGDREAGTIDFPIMWKLSRKIGLATALHVRPRFSSTLSQITNYGLGGLCETHVDPHGMIEGTKVTEQNRSLFWSGDMIGTFMAWLEDVEAGGATAFDYPGYEQMVSPTRGSAAFWISLDRRGFRDQRSSHGGCPVATGSKWILNKWMFYFNQWRDWPCGLKKHMLFKKFEKVF